MYQNPRLCKKHPNTKYVNIHFFHITSKSFFKMLEGGARQYIEVKGMP